MLTLLVATPMACPPTQAVAVADSTVAFSQWAFGSAEGALPEEAAAEPMAGLEPATGKIALRNATCLRQRMGEPAAGWQWKCKPPCSVQDDTPAFDSQ